LRNLTNNSSNFTETYLRNLIAEKVQGDFEPFQNGNIQEVEAHIKIMLGRLRDNKNIKIEADFDAYGSGFASYINVKITKRDRSDTVFSKNGEIEIEDKNGLILYISNLSPFWYFGGENWTENYLKGIFQGGTMPFLRPENREKYDKKLWQDDVNHIINLFDEYRYRLLTETELEPYINFKTEIASIMADKPYQIFDCFFHWED
jgi:hypothetical protein